jgi:Ca2+/Na+ antiporter
MIDNILINLSNSKLFGGCIMLLTNIGGKYLMMDMPNNMEKIFSNNFILRCLVLFSVFFMATRDIKTSVLLSLLYFIVMYFFINEKSSFCIIKNDSNSTLTPNLNSKITLEEYNKAKEIINNYNLRK